MSLYSRCLGSFSPSTKSDCVHFLFHYLSFFSISLSQILTQKSVMVAFA